MAFYWPLESPCSWGKDRAMLIHPCLCKPTGVFNSLQLNCKESRGSELILPGTYWKDDLTSFSALSLKPLSHRPRCARCAVFLAFVLMANFTILCVSLSLRDVLIYPFKQMTQGEAESWSSSCGLQILSWKERADLHQSKQMVTPQKLPQRFTSATHIFSDK